MSDILGYNRIISKDILLYPNKISFISQKDIPKDLAITDKVGYLRIIKDTSGYLCGANSQMNVTTFIYVQILKAPNSGLEVLSRSGGRRSQATWWSHTVRLHIFSENSWFFQIFWKSFRFFQISSDFFRQAFWNIFWNRNCKIVTSELDSESHSTLRKNIFKRDSCKLLVDVTSVTSACKLLISEKIRKSQKASKSFRKIQKVSESFRKFQKVSESADLT